MLPVQGESMQWLPYGHAAVKYHSAKDTLVAQARSQFPQLYWNTFADEGAFYALTRTIVAEATQVKQGSFCW